MVFKRGVFIEKHYDTAGELVRKESYVEGEELKNGINIEEHVFNNKGWETQSFTYNSLDPSSKFYSEREYDEDGKLVSEPDATGKHKTSYRYAANSDKLLGELLPNGSEFAYGYDEVGRVTAITHSTEDGEENANNTSYTYGCATEVRSGNNVVRYTYDHKRRVTAVELNGVENYVTYAYEDVTVDGKQIKKVTATMPDNSSTTVIKDMHGNTLSTTIGGKTVTYTYDNKNRLTSIEGRIRGVNDPTYAESSQEAFSYTALDKLSRYVYTINSNDVDENGNQKSEEIVCENYTYTDDGQLERKTLNTKENKQVYTYAYKDDTAKSLKSVSVDGFTFSPKLDCLGRNKGKTISFITKNEDDSETWTKIAEEQITYLKFGDHATNIPATVYYGNVKNGNYAFSDHFKYKYDSMGNITEIRENGELYAKYTYDTIGRLVREDNKKLGKTTAFTYDTNGNILCRKEYAFTLTDKLDELDCTDFVYTYDGDKLLSYNGEACEYDAIGNPTTYRGLKASWANGRQLSSYNNTPFTYDNLGRRISKNSVTFTYDANGNLIHQNNGISFIYDASGVCGISHGNSTYFYRKDILGNIVALLNSDGEIVAKYTYDAWGNHTITDTNGNVITDENHIANLNPFRYRGYYYDTGIGLYFLKTRYYDPETGRFITIDDISYLDPDSINGLNLYAYCRNNPVNNADSTGTFAISTFLIVVGISALLGAIDGGITAAMSGQNFWLGFAAGAIGGAIGGVIGYFVPGFGGVLARGASSLTYDLTNEWFQTGSIDINNISLYAVDVLMDMTYSVLYVGYFGNMSSKIVGTALNGVIDAIVDILQTLLLFNPATKNKASNENTNTQIQLKYMNKTNLLYSY